MSNSLIFGSKVVYANGNAITLATRAADPVSGAVAGDIYFNTTSSVIRFFDGSAWADIDHRLLGLSLTQHSVIVGDSSGLSASVDSSSVGDILGDATNGLTIKSAVITNGMVASNAAIAYSKLNLSGSLVDADINSSAAIAHSKMAALTASKVLVSDGSGVVSASSVTSTTLGYLDATSSIQTQLNSKIASSEKGANSGVATLDSGGKVPVSQLPNSVMELKGFFDPATTALADGSGNPGDVWEASAAGSYDFGNGAITFAIGDWAVYAADGKYHKSINSNAVTSVNSQTGSVTINAINELTGDITAGPASGSQSKAATIASGAVTASKLGTVTDGVTLDQSGAGSTLEVKAGGIANSHISSSAAIAYSKLNLGSSIVNADVASGAAIAYSKLNLGSSIVNADVASGAAIAYSKLNLTTSVKAGDINSQSSTSGYVLTADGAGGASFSAVGGGTVTSVAASVPSELLSVSGSPITSSGTLAFSLQNKAANIVFAGPSTGSAAAPTFRSLVANDLPSLTSLYASTDLSNLASTALNASLVPATNDAIDLGSSAKHFSNAYVEKIIPASDLSIQASIVKQSDSPSSTNFKETQYFDALTLAANTGSLTAISSLTFAMSAFRGAIIDYTVREATSNAQRVGRMYIAADGTTTSSSDQYSETAQLGNASGLSLQSAVNSGNIEIQFVNTHATNACTMRCEITRFRA